MLIIRFANHMITENVQVFWAELQRGEFISDAAVADFKTNDERLWARIRQSETGSW